MLWSRSTARATSTGFMVVCHPMPMSSGLRIVPHGVGSRGKRYLLLSWTAAFEGLG